MVWEEGSHGWDPPLTKPTKEGGYPPIPPLLRVGRESPGPRPEVGI